MKTDDLQPVRLQKGGRGDFLKTGSSRNLPVRHCVHQIKGKKGKGRGKQSAATDVPERTGKRKRN